MTTITDYITGRPVADVGAMANRQQVARHLVEGLGIPKVAIAVARALDFEVDGSRHSAMADLVVAVDDRPVMVVRAAAGSIGSYEREIVALARLLAPEGIVPVAVVSDGADAVVLDAVSGKTVGAGLDAIPDWAALAETADRPAPPLPEDRVRRERLLLRTYASATVHVLHP